MRQIIQIDHESSLSTSLVYFIDGCLYYYCGTDSKGKFLFHPLVGQRYTAQLRLIKKHLRRVSEVKGMLARPVIPATQLTLELTRLEAFRGL